MFVLIHMNIIFTHIVFYKSCTYIIFRFEATRRIREMERTANEETNGECSERKSKFCLPILAMTADVIHATYEECLKCGMDGYVSKPFEEGIVQVVISFLVVLYEHIWRYMCIS
jgi:CheY-like chemotaxis protein